jgi:hypothetical protein
MKLKGTTTFSVPAGSKVTIEPPSGVDPCPTVPKAIYSEKEFLDWIKAYGEWWRRQPENNK